MRGRKIKNQVKDKKKKKAIRKAFRANIIRYEFFRMAKLRLWRKVKLFI